MNLKIINSIYLFLTIIFIFSLLSCNQASRKEHSKVKNIVLIYTDELDYSDLEVYGGDFKTPNINKLAEDGITFKNAYTTSPVCNPSRFSVMTGQYPGRTKSKKFLLDNPINEPYVLTQNASLTRETVTIPKLLEANGFTTGVAGKWHLGGTDETKWNSDNQIPKSYFDKGVEEELKKFKAKFKNIVNEFGGFSVADFVYPGNTDALPFKELRFHNFGWMTKGAVKFIEMATNKDNPFFLYVTPTAIHGPNHVESLEFDQNITMNGYDTSLINYRPNSDSLISLCSEISPQASHRLIGISNIDYQVKLIIEELKQKKIYNETLIIFMADHGIEPGKATCYDRGMKAPLIIKLPKNNRKGTTSDLLVQNVDLLPTILEYTGIKVPDNHQIDGISLYKYLENNEVPNRKYIYTETGLSRSVTDGKYKYISFRYPKSTLDKMKNGEIDYAPNQWNMFKQQHSAIAIKYHKNYFDTDQLYHLGNDPYEMENLAYKEDYKLIVDKYRNVTKEFTDSFEHPYEYYDDEFLKTEKFNILVEKTKSLGVDWIDWWKRDHDFDYPPVNVNK